MTHKRTGRRGYVLLEIILALAVFMLAGAGLMRTLQVGVQTASVLKMENDIRVGLRSFLEEVRRKPLAEMEQEFLDERLGVTFQSQIDEMDDVTDRNGNRLRDLYKLHVFATYMIGSEERQEAVDMWIYKQRSEGRR